MSITSCFASTIHSDAETFAKFDLTTIIPMPDAGFAPVAYFMCPQWRQAMELYGRMLRDGLMPDKYIMDLLIELLDSMGQYEQV